MNNKIRFTLIAIIIFVLFESILTTNTLAKSVFIEQIEEQFIVVDINGNGDFKKITEALVNAPAGSTIYIKKGEYKEIIDIKNQIKLLGEDKKSTIINPISEKNKYAIRLGASDIVIQNLGIKNDAPGLYSTGIKVTSSNIEIKNCNIFETPIGIAIWTSNNLIKNCTFWRCNDEGIALIGSSYFECKNNKIINCKFYQNCDGIELQYSSDNKILDCDFYDNTHTGIDAILNSNNNNIISNCKIYNNEVNGIFFSSSSENKIIDCLIYKNDDGNLITSGNSKNNQILSSSELKKEVFTISHVKIINNILKKISNNLINKIIVLFESTLF